MLAVTLAASAFAALWIEHRLGLELPTPTGPFAVGRTADAWDGLAFWLWYPAAAGAPVDDYLPAAIRPSGSAHVPGSSTF